MPAWITVYCRRSVASITPKQLLRGITGGDTSAHAGVDYDTLAEGYDVDEDEVDPALKHLAVDADNKSFTTYELRYAASASARPVSVQRWSEPARVKEEIREVVERLEPPKPIVGRLRKSIEVVGIELGFSQLNNMGVVFAYETARYLAQKGDGLIVDLEDRFTVVKGGGFEDA